MFKFTLMDEVGLIVKEETYSEMYNPKHCLHKDKFKEDNIWRIICSVIAIWPISEHITRGSDWNRNHGWFTSGIRPWKHLIWSLKKTSESFSLKSKLLWINSPQIEIKKYPKVIKIHISNRCSCGHANLCQLLTESLAPWELCNQKRERNETSRSEPTEHRGS